MTGPGASRDGWSVAGITSAGRPGLWKKQLIDVIRMQIVLALFIFILLFL